MASGKRQPSKQKRAAQNRAQRAALAARRDAATAAARPASSSGGSRPAAGGGLLGRLRSGAGGSGGTGVRGQLAEARAAQPIGYRAALSALLMSLAGVLFCFTFQVPVDAEGESYTAESLTVAWATSALDIAADDPTLSAAEVAESVDDWTPGRSEDPIAIALWPFSLALALPVIGAGIGFRAVAKRARSKIVSRALFATLFGSLLSQIPIFFIPTVVALGVSVFQIRRYETVTAAAAMRAGAEPDDAGGIIEADVVEDDPAAGDDEPNDEALDDAAEDPDRTS